MITTATTVAKSPDPSEAGPTVNVASRSWSV
jgi:hypothetical protein